MSLQQYYNYFRYYDPQTGRYITSDPIGLDGGLKTYSYALLNPIGLYDPYGLWVPPSLPQGVVDFSAGFGDALLLGFGDDIRNISGVDGGVDVCSTLYGAGELASIFAGGAGAAKTAFTGLRRGMSRFNLAFPRNREWVERSHMIADRFGGPMSGWNTRLIWGSEHAAIDPKRYRFIKKAFKDVIKLRNPLARLWGRMTAPARGLAGAGIIGAGILTNSASNQCECK